MIIFINWNNFTLEIYCQNTLLMMKLYEFKNFKKIHYMMILWILKI